MIFIKAGKENCWPPRPIVDCAIALYVPYPDLIMVKPEPENITLLSPLASPLSKMMLRPFTRPCVFAAMGLQVVGE